MNDQPEPREPFTAAVAQLNTSGIATNLVVAELCRLYKVTPLGAQQLLDGTSTADRREQSGLPRDEVS
ncbi:MAG: hypothetical protein ACR2GH_17655 [Pseudonocardia sp.]